MSVTGIGKAPSASMAQKMVSPFQAKVMSSWLATIDLLSLDKLKTPLRGKLLSAEQKVMAIFSRVVGYLISTHERS